MSIKKSTVRENGADVLEEVAGFQKKKNIAYIIEDYARQSLCEVVIASKKIFARVKEHHPVVENVYFKKNYAPSFLHKNGFLSSMI